MSQSRESPVALVSPPRPVPATVCVGAMFGGGRTQFGWLLLAAAVAPVWWLAQDPSFSPIEAFAMLGPTKEVQGVVTKLIEGRKDRFAPFARDGYGHEYRMERVEIRGVRYGYRGPDGAPLTGVAYGLRQNTHDRYADVGASIPVKYSTWRPQLSKVSGLSGETEARTWCVTALFWGAILVGGMGLMMAGEAVIRGLSGIRLMGKGKLAAGRLIHSETVARGGGRQSTRRLTYAFNDGSADHRATVISDASGEELAALEEQPIFYNPRRPGDDAIAAGEIAGRLEIDKSGHLTEGDSNPYHFLWLPVACAMVYAWFVLNQLDMTDPPSLAFLSSVLGG